MIFFPIKKHPLSPHTENKNVLKEESGLNPAVPSSFFLKMSQCVLEACFRTVDSLLTELIPLE